ncbi:MAG: hypothetical protein WB770_08950 [Acidimicrobiales bacterium]
MTRLRQRRGDLIALAVLIGIPLLVFGVPAAAGYPLLTGDNVIQNYPLRVLAGEILSHGHLPVYNPFAWAGTPLLSSANSTVAFPDVALFAFLPGIVAWVAVEVIAFAGAAVGLYVFLRSEGLDPLPAGLGGAIYGLGGYVSSQAIHLDVVQTAASFSWVLVGLQRIGRGGGRHLLAWTALLAAAVAAAGLSGNPESEFYAAVGAAVFAISVVASSRHRARSAALVAIGTFVGALIASVQVIPAERFVSISQRASVPFSYLSRGSVRPAELSLVVLPHLLGGGLIGVRHYVGGANLAEIDVYPGLIALVGVVALTFFFNSPNASRIRVWYLIGAIGLVVALGPATFLPHVSRHLPVVGMSRLPSRALVLPAAAFAVIGGFWCAEFLEPGLPRPKRRSPSRRAHGLELAAQLMPTVAVVGLVIATIAGGRRFAREVAGQPIESWTLAHVAPYLAIACALALLVTAVVVIGPRLSPRRRAVALVSVVVLDLLVFTANQTSLAPIRLKDLGQPNRYESALRRIVGPEGRFVIVDQGRGGRYVLNDLGAPNLNVFFKIASAQGYGSLTWGPYATATGTHNQDAASPSAFSTDVFDSLDVRAVLALDSSFESAPNPIGGDPIGVSRFATTTRYFGAFVDVRSICVGFGYTPVREVATYESEVRFVGGDTTSSVHFSRASCGVKAEWIHGERAVGIVFPRAPSGVATIDATVTTAKGRTFGLDGPLSSTVTSPHWLELGRIGPYFVFRNADAWPQLSGFSPATGRRVALVAHVASESAWTPTEIVDISVSQKTLLVRDVAAIPGWTAQIDHDGKFETDVVRRDGVVQAIDVPKGESVVTYRYDAPGLSLGEDLALGGVVLWLALIALDRRVGSARAALASEESAPRDRARDETADPTN